MILGPANGVQFVRPPHGVLRPDGDVLAIRIARALDPRHVAAMAAPLPLRSDLNRGRRKDQGRSSACSAHALNKGIENATGFLGSDHVLYSATGSRDVGRRLVDVLATAASIGLAPYEGDSPDGRFSDVWTANDTSAKPPNVCVAPTDAELSAAIEHRYDFGGNSIDPKSPDLRALVVGTLAIDSCIYLATQVGRAFESLGRGQVAAPDVNDPDSGGHALIIDGHMTLAPETEAEFVTKFGDGFPEDTTLVKVASSWGEEWDEDGECWASLAWVASAWECHPLYKNPSPSLLQRIEAAL
jgi:hypothetical protein